jgi:uncharacterized protein YacL
MDRRGWHVAARLGLVAAASALGWLSAGAGGPRLGAALAGATAGLAAVAAERALRGADPARILGGFVGLLLGLLAARLAAPSLGAALSSAGLPPGLGPVLVTLALGWIGLVTGARELRALRLPRPSRTEERRPEPSSPAPPRPEPSAKVVDTSVIIDARIGELVETGFVEGRLVIPQFVLKELQQVADASDPNKRARGRRGLEVLTRVQDNERVEVAVLDRDYPDIDDVDGKLVALADELGAKLLTNDYNLNQVAQLRGVSVLNVNDLANAVKPVVLPGESLRVQVIKEGQQRGQGVGYLDDGTMIVVEGGLELLGEHVDVIATSVIQTTSGKMVFAAPDRDDIKERLRIARRDSSGSARSAHPGA